MKLVILGAGGHGRALIELICGRGGAGDRRAGGCRPRRGRCWACRFWATNWCCRACAGPGWGWPASRSAMPRLRLAAAAAARRARLRLPFAGASSGGPRGKCDGRGGQRGAAARRAGRLRPGRAVLHRQYRGDPRARCGIGGGGALRPRCRAAGRRPGRRRGVGRRRRGLPALCGDRRGRGGRRSARRSSRTCRPAPWSAGCRRGSCTMGACPAPEASPAAARWRRESVGRTPCRKHACSTSRPSWMRTRFPAFSGGSSRCVSASSCWMASTPRRSATSPPR